ncbi:hypothetical protein B0H14DRAFT_1154205 [Mycena olivaceomarginata]|nr:hypothetical protein B0H14DRAFT_1154205 [Mycena olivaceomarginata]
MFRHTVQSLDFPVGMTHADLTGDGYNDAISCDRYGPGMTDLWDAKIKNGGRIQWLKNPATGLRSSLGLHTTSAIQPECTGELQFPPDFLHTSEACFSPCRLSVLSLHFVHFASLVSDISVAGHLTDSTHIQVLGFLIISASKNLS